MHTQLRWTTQNPKDTEWLALFTKTGVVNAWQITRTNLVAAKNAASGSYKKHSVEIQAVMAVKDSASSEMTFAALLDAVVDDLMDGDRTLGGVSRGYSDPSATQEYATFDGVLVHRSSIKLTVTEEEGC